MEHPSGTTKLFPTGYIYGAGEGDRTLATSLEGWGSTTELHPHNCFEKFKLYTMKDSLEPSYLYFTILYFKP